MRHFFQFMDNFEKFFASLALWGLVAASFLQVIARYFFNRAFSWPEEMSRYMLVCLVFLGISSVMKVNGHLRVEIMSVWLPRPVVRVMNMISAAIISLFCIYATYLSIEMTLLVYDMEQLTQSLEFPAWITWLPMPIGFFFTALQNIRYEWKRCAEFSASSEGE